MRNLISVIIPLYNAELTILRCLNSLKVQSYKKIEVIIVNDGSTDGSFDLVKEYVEKNKFKEWKLFSIFNQGVSKARNFGIDRAKGEYLCFVDADDYVEREYIEKMYLAMQEYNCDLCISSYYKILEKKGYKKIQKCAISDCFYYNIPSLKASESLFINGFMHPCWGKLYKTNIVKENKIIFPDQSLSEDTMFNLEYLSYVTSIKTINPPLYNYIINSDCDSLSKSLPLNIFDIYITIHKKYVDLFKKYGLDRIIIDKMMYPQYYSAIIKILFKKELSYKEKKNILDKALCKREVLNSFLIKQDNKTLLLINKLFFHKKYRLLIYIVQLSKLKEMIDK